MPPRLDTSVADAAAAVSSPPSPLRHRPHRVSRACDFCHSRSIRCRPGGAGSASCQSCLEYDRKCTYDRPARKRGVKAGAGSAPSTSAAEHGGPLGLPDGLTPEAVTELVELYFAIVYPIFPFFHRKTLLHRISRGERTHDRPFFGALMAMCGLAAARARDGAAMSPSSLLADLPPSAAFGALAAETLPREPHAGAGAGLDSLRTCGLLALLAIQDGDVRGFKFFLGAYHTLMHVDGLDQELNWPAHIGRVEIEERRRLFWGMYTLQIFSVACFDGSLVCREAHAAVRYPTPVDDDGLADYGGDAASSDPNSSGSSERQGMESSGSLGSTRDLSSSSPPNWLVGWNFTIDMYRVLEHALERQKSLAMAVPSASRALFNPAGASNDAILHDVMARYDALPPQFKETRPVTLDQGADRYGFEAAHITATMQLVRMTLYMIEPSSSIQQRFQIVAELLRTFSEVPIGYLKAISTPLLHHLASIGASLGAALRAPLLEGEYAQIRAVLAAFADLLGGLAAGSRAGDDPGSRLRAQIGRMDRLVEDQRLARTPSSPPSPPLAPSASSTSYGFPTVDPHADTDLRLYFPPDVLQEWAEAFDLTHVSE